MIKNWLIILLMMVMYSCTPYEVLTSKNVMKYRNVKGAVNSYTTTLNWKIENRFYIEEEDYNRIISHLKNNLKIDVENKDLIINYVFNSDPCRRNSANYSYIGIQPNKDVHVENYDIIHPNLKFIFLREEGKNFDLSVVKDERKIIDVGGFFRKNIFNYFGECGNSIILLRDRSGIFIKRDVHIIGGQLYLDNNSGGNYKQ